MFQTIFGGHVRLRKETKSYYVKNGYVFYFTFINKYKWRTGKRFKKCSYLRLTKKEVKANNWLNGDFKPFKALQNLPL